MVARDSKLSWGSQARRSKTTWAADLLAPSRLATSPGLAKKKRQLSWERPNTSNKKKTQKPGLHGPLSMGPVVQVLPGLKHGMTVVGVASRDHKKAQEFCAEHSCGAAAGVENKIDA